MTGKVCLISEKSEHRMDQLKEAADAIIQSAIEAVKPERIIRRKIRLKNDRLSIESLQLNLHDFEKIYVIGAGKASALMAREMENLLGERLFYGVVTVKYGHGAPCRKIRILEAGHPVLDENGLNATSQILQTAEGAGEKDLVLCLISGGGSALLEKLPAGLSLKGVQKVFQLLLASGANIEEINVVRKHLSLVKGGQLARAVSPATCVSLILSDVIGDPLPSIASGPTSADPSTFNDAWKIMEHYLLLEQLPAGVRDYFRNGCEGEMAETPKTGDPLFEKVHNIILGNNLDALYVARKKAESLGFGTMILSSRIQGEAREVARVLAGIAQEMRATDLPLKRPACLLMGGETTVTLKGNGKGGRNQELALAALLAMKNVSEPYLIFSCGTDGTDGPTDAAGGMAFPDMWEQVRDHKLDPVAFLRDNNAYPFLQKTGGLIKTGPTGTNVMDIMGILIP
jgi:glycerate 2-kinase